MQDKLGANKNFMYCRVKLHHCYFKKQKIIVLKRQALENESYQNKVLLILYREMSKNTSSSDFKSKAIKFQIESATIEIFLNILNIKVTGASLQDKGIILNGRVTYYILAPPSQKGEGLYSRKDYFRHFTVFLYIKK